MGEEQQQQTNQNVPQQQQQTEFQANGLVTSEIEESEVNDKATLVNNMLDPIESDIWAQLRSNGFYRPQDMKYNTMFYRFRRIDPYYMVEGGTEYLFFTKPSLQLVDTGGELIKYTADDTSITGRFTDGAPAGPDSSSYFSMLMANGYYNTIMDLSYQADRVGPEKNDMCPFVRLLSNRKTSNMDIPDITVGEISTAQNLYGSKIYYPTSSMKSDEDLEFSIEFEDTQFLEVYHFFKAYDKYRQMKYLGMIQPDITTTLNKILHDHMSIYKFIVDTDGETILYFAKATGVYPKTISRSAFSEFPEKGQLKITVTFKLSGWFEDMEPAILMDFNALVSRWICNGSSNILDKKDAYFDIWDDSISGINGDNVSYFYVDYVTSEQVKKGQYDLNKEYGRFYLVAGKR